MKARRAWTTSWGLVLSPWLVLVGLLLLAGCWSIDWNPFAAIDRLLYRVTCRGAENVTRTFVSREAARSFKERMESDGFVCDDVRRIR